MEWGRRPPSPCKFQPAQGRWWLPAQWGCLPGTWASLVAACSFCCGTWGWHLMPAEWPALALTCRWSWRAGARATTGQRCHLHVQYNVSTRASRGRDAGNLTIDLYRLSEHYQNLYKNQILIENYEYTLPDAAISNIRVFGGTFCFWNLWYGLIPEDRVLFFSFFIYARVP